MYNIAKASEQDRRVLFRNTAQQTGLHEAIIEKDFWVCLTLDHLFHHSPWKAAFTFKGGTSLSKCYGLIQRFSEDIDLSVDTRGCSRTQNDKRLERAAKKYVSLPRDATQGKTNRSEVIAVYTYDPITAFDADDALQRFGKLKVEATSFTISEPVDSLEISAMLYNLATEEQKKILETVYDVKPFFIQTITLERIFVDKLFAAEAYVRHSSINQRAFEAAKHIYDLAVIAQHPKVSALLSDSDKLKNLLEIRMKEEQGRLDGIPGVAPTEFIFFTQAGDNSDVRKAYETMQNQYVLREQDRIEFETAVKALMNIQESLLKNPAWADFHNTTI